MAAPKGHPKWGGRRKGTPNRVHAATRDRIAAGSDPIGFLMEIVSGVEINEVVPTLEQRMNAAKVLAGKVLPDLKTVEMDYTTPARDIEDLTDEELRELLEREGNGRRRAAEEAGSQATADTVC